uniref:Uncharacterized protein n=1 Tax=Timema monikensis TaxID=170555 RepID=A0A7R9EK16_9NEOP|nr:unnamed protein product [Timema monikensis]
MNIKVMTEIYIDGWNFQLKRWWAYCKLYCLSQSDRCVSEDQQQILPSKEEERMEAPKKLNLTLAYAEDEDEGESLEPHLLEVALTFAVLQWVEDLDVNIEYLSTHFHNIDLCSQKGSSFSYANPFGGMASEYSVSGSMSDVAVLFMIKGPVTGTFCLSNC